MIVKLIDREPFKANDLTVLREILHPNNNNIDLPYSLAYAFLEKDETSLLHSLIGSEVYFIIKGIGQIILGGDQYDIEKGDCIYVAPNTPQKVKNIGDSRLEFICIVSPPWSEKEEEIMEL